MPSSGITETKSGLNKPIDQKFYDIPYDELTLVRVQRGINEISGHGSDLILNHKMSQEDSVRNTMHFALNSYVQDHAYGRFNDAKFVFVAKLLDTAKENPISGLGASDTWFHAQNDSIVLPKATLIAPDTAQIPEDLLNSDVKIILYMDSPDPEQSKVNRDAAITQELNDRQVPIRSIDLHNWVGHHYQEDQQLNLSKALGRDTPLPTNHASSLDGSLESAFSQVTEAYKSLASGEKQWVNQNTGQFYDLDTHIKKQIKGIEQSISELEVPTAQTFFTEKLNSLTTKFESINTKDTPIILSQAFTSSAPPPPPPPIDMPSPVSGRARQDQIINLTSNLIQNDQLREAVNAVTQTLQNPQKSQFSYFAVQLVAFDERKAQLDAALLNAAESLSSNPEVKSMMDSPKTQTITIDTQSGPITLINMAVHKEELLQIAKPEDLQNLDGVLADIANVEIAAQEVKYDLINDAYIDKIMADQNLKTVHSDDLDKLNEVSNWLGESISAKNSTLDALQPALSDAAQQYLNVINERKATAVSSLDNFKEIVTRAKTAEADYSYDR